MAKKTSKFERAKKAGEQLTREVGGKLHAFDAGDGFIRVYVEVAKHPQRVYELLKQAGIKHEDNFVKIDGFEDPFRILSLDNGTTRLACSWEA